MTPDPRQIIEMLLAEHEQTRWLSRVDGQHGRALVFAYLLATQGVESQIHKTVVSDLKGEILPAPCDADLNSYALKVVSMPGNQDVPAELLPVVANATAEKIRTHAVQNFNRFYPRELLRAHWGHFLSLDQPTLVEGAAALRQHTSAVLREAMDTGVVLIEAWALQRATLGAPTIRNTPRL